MLHTVFKHTTRMSVQTMMRRQASTATPAFVKAGRAARSKGVTQKNWLSDPATYPLIATLSGALALVLGVGVSCLMYNPDVQINPEIRGNIGRPEIK